MKTKNDPDALSRTEANQSIPTSRRITMQSSSNTDNQATKAPKPRLKHYILREDAGVCATYCGQRKPSAWKVGAGTGRPVAQRVLCPDCENLHQLHADMEDSIGTGSQKLLTLLDALDRLEDQR